MLGLVEHEVPEHGLVKLLELRQEDLEIVEVQIGGGSPAPARRVGALALPDGLAARSPSCANGVGEIAVGETMIMPGDQVIAILEPGKTDELERDPAQSGAARALVGLLIVPVPPAARPAETLRWLRAPISGSSGRAVGATALAPARKGLPCRP